MSHPSSETTEKAITAQKFKRQLDAFFDSLHMTFPDETMFEIARHAVGTGAVSVITLIEGFRKALLPYKENIFGHDEAFFLTTDLFDTFSKTVSNYFKTFWKTRLHQENKEQMYRWFEVFYTLAERYK